MPKLVLADSEGKLSRQISVLGPTSESYLKVQKTMLLKKSL